jgi:hypothetical protein
LIGSWSLDVMKALKRERDSDTAEGRTLEEIFTLQGAARYR